MGCRPPVGTGLLRVLPSPREFITAWIRLRDALRGLWMGGAARGFRPEGEATQGRLRMRDPAGVDGGWVCGPAVGRPPTTIRDASGVRGGRGSGLGEGWPRSSADQRRSVGTPSSNQSLLLSLRFFRPIGCGFLRVFGVIRGRGVDRGRAREPTSVRGRRP